jgi:hypothetical protein
MIRKGMEGSLPQWKFASGKEANFIQAFNKEALGFIYEVEFNNGKKYLGRKALYHTRTLKPLKGKKKKRIKVVESDWLKYIGSFKDEELKEQMKSGHLTVVKRTILRECLSKWEMSYYETKHLFEKDCLLSNEYYNNNILGKFYKPK